jgi:DNA (cytosine-5)-methyltransferase 1
MRYTILDLYCGAGGAAAGYNRAGFNVIGADVEPQPRYPFEFIHDDVLTVLDELDFGGCYTTPPGQRLKRRCLDLEEVDAIHASPPCQRYSISSKCRPGLAARYPDLIEPTRERLEAVGLPYVIENVPRAPLRNPVWLCGCQFRCETEWPGKGIVQLRRKRGFETIFPLPVIGGHRHDAPTLTVAGHRNPTSSRRIRSIPVFGHGVPGNRPDLRGPGYQKASREVMGIDWMTRDELNEAIPPVFTEYVGTHLMNYLRAQERQAA